MHLPAAQALAKLLDERAVMVSLNLSDNHVHADGGKYFGRAPRRRAPRSPIDRTPRADNRALAAARTVAMAPPRAAHPAPRRARAATQARSS